MVWQSEQPTQRLVQAMLPPASSSNGFGFAPVNDVMAFGTPTRGWRARGVVIPYWAPLALFLVPPLAWTRTLLRRQGRGRRGLCVRCGYDIRATPGRCPECGNAVTPTA